MAEAETKTPVPEPPAHATTAPGEVTLTLSDIEAGLASLPRAKATRYIVWGGAVAVVALVAYRWIEGRERTSLIVMALVLLGILLLNANPAKRIAKKVFASLPEDNRTMRIGVDQNGFSVTSSGSESLLPWTDVQRCVDAGRVLVVFMSQHDGQILPKRAFTPTELGAIREWSRTKIVKRNTPNEPWLTPELRRRVMIWLVVFALVWTAVTLLGNR